MEALWTVERIIEDKPEGWMEPVPEYGPDAAVVHVQRRMVIEITCESAHRLDLYRHAPGIATSIQVGRDVTYNDG